MAESPAPLNAPEKRVVGRPFPKGHPGGPGRAPLPECFTSLEPLALAQLAASATGVVVLELVPEHLNEEQRSAAIGALNAAATDTDPKLRLDAACRFSDRVRGRPKEQVEHSGETTQRAVLEVRFKEAPAREPLVIDVGSKKALRDAE